MLQVFNIFAVILLFKLIFVSAPTAPPPSSEVVFLISSQQSSYHRQLAAKLQQHIIKQSQSMASPDYVVSVRLLHEIFNQPGDWTLLTALPQLTGIGGDAEADSSTVFLISNNTNWIVLCEENTHVNLDLLLKKLRQENETQLQYLGHPLYDHEATIIHHFAFFENPRWFPYPSLRSGVVFTGALIKRLATLVADKRKTTRLGHTEFSIDAAYELARFIWDNVRVESNSGRSLEAAAASSSPNNVAGGPEHAVKHVESNEISMHSHEDSTTAPRHVKNFENLRKIILKRASYICPAAASGDVVPSNKGDGCAMYAKRLDAGACLPAKREHIYFAIKTCQRYHSERIPIIEATWARHATYRRYFSDVADANIPTISTGIPNVETGHCSKTLAIMKLALEDIERLHRNLNQQVIRWLLLCDDDTLLSVSGICEVLGCHDPYRQVYLGERYGYRLHAADGFNYITGGGGIALSLSAVRLVLQHCSCPSETAPDDMILGACLHALQLNVTHTPRFHQARPLDYPRELLELEPPVSFHKFWQLDPLAVYEEWFAAADRLLLSAQPTKMSNKLKSHNSVNRSRRTVASIGSCRSELKKCLDLVQDNNASSQKLPLAELQHVREKHLDL